MKVSIAMTTYNGEKYIKEQLLSFSNQTVLPNELVICDDGSNDNTIHIIEEFQKTAPYEIKIFKNKNRLGFSQNFSKALRLTSGDIVFLSDQDDVWFSNKIEICLNKLNQNTDKSLLIHDAIFTNEKLKPSSYLKYGWNIDDKDIYKKLINNGGITGNCCVVRKEFLNYILPVPKCFYHDEWLGVIAYNLDLLLPLSDILIYYRRHENAVSSTYNSVSKNILFNSIYKIIKLLKNSNPLYDEYSKYIELHSFLKKIDNHYFNQDRLDSLLKKNIIRIKNSKLRMKILKYNFFRRLLHVIKNYFTLKYKCFNNPWKRAIEDILKNS